MGTAPLCDMWIIFILHLKIALGMTVYYRLLQDGGSTQGIPRLGRFEGCRTVYHVPPCLVVMPQNHVVIMMVTLSALYNTCINNTLNLTP